MLNCELFYKLLNNYEIDFFTGVPDSLLKDFCAYITDNVLAANNIITANEGSAIALAAGYHLSTGKSGLVYMQNSGQGNSINPLASLVDRKVYCIPVLLLIGWRGRTGKKDEPQHVKQGQITLKLLDVLEIPYEILPKSMEKTEKSIQRATDYMKKTSSPYALVVRNGTFEPHIIKKEMKNSYELTREDALKLVINHLNKDDIVVSTTGMISRELFEYREKLGHGHDKDFLTVGSMGHSSQIALGIALSKLNTQVYCLDGDGAVIMHMGSLAIIGQQAPINFKHIVLNNGAHDSVGGQPTAGFKIDIASIANSCDYKLVMRAETSKEIPQKMNLLKTANGPALLEIRVNKGYRKDLGRPTISPLENKKAFMNFIKNI